MTALADRTARPGFDEDATILTGPLILPDPEAEARARRRDRLVVWLVTLAAACLSAGAYVHFASDHLTLAYKDVYSHLEIGRRVVAGFTPGIAQLGGVWLPLPSALQALLAWIPALYRTGLSGSLVSMVCFVGCSVLTYRIVRVFSPERYWPALLGAAVFMTNPNVLYLQSTAMDELPYYFFAIGMVYCLVRWVDSGRVSYLLAASLSSMGAMLCRYEAWFMAVVFVCCAAAMARRLGHDWRDVRGLALVATVFGLASAAIAWLFYNWVIFGSPLNFLTGANSAQAQTTVRADAEIGSFSTSARAYGIAMTGDVGLLVLGLALAGFILLVVRERASARSLPVLAMLAVPLFLYYSIESGQVAIGVPQINDDLYNLRFGLAVLLPGSMLVGYLAAQWPRRWPSFIPVVAGLAMLAVVGGVPMVRGNVALAAEAEGATAFLVPQAQTADVVLHQTSGPILMNAYGNERVLFPVLERTVYEGSKDSHADLWQRALNNPKASGIHVIVMRMNQPQADDVYKALHGSPMLNDYKLLFQNANYLVYELK